MAAMDPRLGAHPQPYPNLPASPTLTNPDMILPDYDFALSPGLDDDEDRPARSQSPLMMWKNAHAASSTSDLQQLFAGSSQEHHAFPAGPITPTTPIIYGNGTMLSDIGEVTEAESTPGRPSPGSVRRRTAGGAGGNSGPFGASSGSPSGSRTPSPTPLPHNLRHPFHHNSLQNALNSRDNLSDAPRRSSPTMGVEETPQHMAVNNNGVKQRARQQQTARRDSLESNSTITTQDHAGLFADFDDTVSVGESAFQGDDEESVAESYVEEPYVAREVPVMSTASSSLLAVPDFGGNGSSSGGNTSDEGDRRLSAATLSLRAEKILANAKKRLTTMEGNLNRARSSLYISSPPAGSLHSDGSTPSPRTPVRSATASSRYHDPNPGSPIHSRVVSDGSVPINGVLPGNFPLQRSASALGAAGGYRKPQLTGSKSADRIDEIQDSLSGGYHRAGLAKPVDIVLERLDEDGADDDNEILPSQNRSSAQLESFLSPTFGSGVGGGGQPGLTRSASVAQMRDLKDQMKGLKGKISTLREQARADSLKRRSLQSLRTPSPFTHSQVDQWYAEQPQTNESPESSGNGSPAQNQYQNSWDEGQGAGAIPIASRDVVTPPPRQTTGSSLSGSARLPRSGGSGSSGARRSKRTTAIAPDADQTDEDSVLSAYDDVEDGMVTKLSYANLPRHTIESPVLGDRPASPGEIAPGGDDSDDMRTENGDFSDEGEVRQLEDVFVDSAETGHQQQLDDNIDEAYAVDDEDADVSHDMSMSEQQQQQYEQDDADYESESGESLYHEALQHPLSHEDREDAFDYEHFILHSALGTISQQRLARSGSFSSEDSVETTRGPISSSNNQADAAFPSPNRRTSMSSISTVESADSFATATEGRISRTNLVSSDEEDVIVNHEARQAAAAAKDRPDSLLLAHAAAANQTPAPSSTSTLPEDNASYSAQRNSAEEPRQTQKPPMARRPASAVPGHRPSVSSFESIGTTRSFPLVNRNRINSLSTVNGVGGGAAPGSAMGYRSGSGGNHSVNSSISVLPNGHSSNNSVSSTPTPTEAIQNGRVSSDNEELRSISETLMNETASICEQESGTSDASHLDSKRSISSLGAPFHESSGSAGSVSGSGSGMASHTQALQALSKEDQYLVERLVGNLGRCVLGLSESGRASTESRVFRRRIDAARRILEGLDPV